MPDPAVDRKAANVIDVLRAPPLARPHNTLVRLKTDSDTVSNSLKSRREGACRSVRLLKNCCRSILVLALLPSTLTLLEEGSPSASSLDAPGPLCSNGPGLAGASHAHPGGQPALAFMDWTYYC